MHMLWITMTNLVVILYSRLNKQLTSHKKSLLQLLLCLQVNFIFGSPKMQSYNGVLTLIVLLQLALYQEFGAFSLVFMAAPHATDMDRYTASQQLVAFFLSYALNFYLMAPLLRQFIFMCLAQQSSASEAIQ